MKSYTVLWEEPEGRFSCVKSKEIVGNTICEVMELFLKEVEIPEEILSIGIEATSTYKNRFLDIQSKAH